MLLLRPLLCTLALVIVILIWLWLDEESWKNKTHSEWNSEDVFPQYRETYLFKGKGDKRRGGKREFKGLGLWPWNQF